MRAGWRRAAALGVLAVAGAVAPACVESTTGQSGKDGGTDGALLDAARAVDGQALSDAAADACTPCSCADALAGRCTPVPGCDGAFEARARVVECSRERADAGECVACAAGDLVGCQQCYDRCANELDRCFGADGTCTPKYATCGAALRSTEVVGSEELCGKPRLAFLALGQCACRAGCGTMCPSYCGGGRGDDVATCSTCFNEKYRGACAPVFAECRDVDAGAGDAGPDGDAARD